MRRDAVATVAKGPAYVAWFKEKCFGEACEVEVTTDIGSKYAKVLVSWRPLFGPPFEISSEELKALSLCIGSVRNSAKLLHNPVPGSSHQQLRCEHGGALLRVFQPKDRPASYSLSVGLFQREGKLENLSSREIDDVIARLEALEAQVLAKVTDLDAKGRQS